MNAGRGEGQAMEHNFPAAHSMDTTWFGVDRDGRVGLFETGEDGIVPEDAHAAEAPADLFGPMLAGRVPVDEDDDEAFYGTEDLVRLGFYVYDCDDFPVPGFYDQSAVPKRPLHIDELPPSMREAVGQMRFDDLSFAEAKRLHPGDDTPIQAWGPVFLSSDGKTVLAIPGREREYEQHCRDLIQYAPEATRKYVFPGLADETDAGPQGDKRKRKK